ncbi:hypothetical protein HZF08_13575 [Paenibacillus sp. CGMCC 1.16610]|uniref:Uncharacterized protein n=1 Tax=Paenibacillus anseongense TaxID=2682845 RepID=A0ABW9U5I8_9BACL|nr:MULTISPECIES: hypothetical protein [Paenibacillus]MBA2939340.1 hypothetical protein [Paenibacillus sp. CGMCC 1.16610]MVQ35298.1 hypothetical protein [Paenibacillus anseongense]
MKKKHSKAQIDYLASREHFLQISNQADKRIADLKEAGQEVGQAELEDIIERVGLHRAYNELTQAENLLINWTQIAIKTEPEFIANRSNFEELYERVKTDAEARGALLNLAMRLNLDLA